MCERKHRQERCFLDPALDLDLDLILIPVLILVLILFLVLRLFRLRPLSVVSVRKRSLAFA